MVGANGKFTIGHDVYVRMIKGVIRCVQVRPGIVINRSVRPIGNYHSGEIFASSGHVHLTSSKGIIPNRDDNGMPDDYSDGGKNIPFEMVKAHELGHAEEAIDWWKLQWKDDLTAWILTNQTMLYSQDIAQRKIQDFLIRKNADQTHRFYSNLQANIRETDYWRSLERSGMVKIEPTQIIAFGVDNLKQRFIRVWKKR